MVLVTSGRKTEDSLELQRFQNISFTISICRNEYPTDTLASNKSEYTHTANNTAHLARNRHPNAVNVQGNMSPINHKPGQLFLKVTTNVYKKC